MQTQPNNQSAPREAGEGYTIDRYEVQYQVSDPDGKHNGQWHVLFRSPKTLEEAREKLREHRGWQNNLRSFVDMGAASGMRIVHVVGTATVVEPIA